MTIPNRPRRRSSFPCGCIIIITVLAFGIGAVFALAKQPAVATAVANIAGPDIPKWTADRPVTLLLIGMDQREEGSPSRSDTLMVAMLDAESKKVSLLSIPRDLWVTVPGYGENRINTAFFYGQGEGDGGIPAGAGLAALTITYNFGIPIDYWACVDFRGFEKIIDALGGVTIDVPQEITDYAYPDDNYGTMTIHFDPGMQHMDGVTALRYARTRHSSSDFDRARRQQQIIAAVRDQVLSPAILPKLPKLAQTLSQSIQTNANTETILSLAGLARDMKEMALDNRVVDESMAANYVTASGAYVLLPDWNAIGALTQELFAPTLPQGAPLANIGIRVENATGIAGLASQSADFLQKQGAVITTVADHQGGVSERTVLYVYASAPEAEAYLRRLYHLADDSVVNASGGPPQTHLTLVLGSDIINRK